MSEPLELRVLSGLHREARCLARHDDVLGADPACDIVLTDTGVGARAARLRLSANGWDLAPGTNEPASAAEPATPFNQPLPLGPVWITVSRRSDPWALLPEAANDRTAGAAIAPDEQSDVAATSADPVQSGEQDGKQEATLASGSRSAGPDVPIAVPTFQVAAAERQSPVSTWLMIVGLVTMIVAVVVAVAIIWLVPASPQPVRQNPRLAAERSLVPINAAIQRLGLTSRLQVALGQDGVVRVSGWVRNAAERDSVAAALAQVWPMPAMRISSEQEAVSTANDVLRNFDIKYEPRYDGNGRLTVRGIADTAQNRAAALDAVRAQLPGMAVMGNDIQLAPAVADDLATALADAGLGGIALAWRDRQLQAGASGLDDSQLTELEAVLAHFNATHLGVATIAPTSGQRQYADTVPFGIRSVVGGPAPFIVLDNGSKLLVGGTYKRYRLTAIEDKRLIFDGPRPAIVLR